MNEKTKQLIDKIFSIEEYKNNCYKQLEKYILSKAKAQLSIKHLNIILVGKTGVGKTSLINAVLKYDKEELLETGFGKPITMGEPEYHTSKNMPLIRLADSRGIELNNYGIESLSESINKFIKIKLETENPDEFVHCIWYCITGTRLEEIEIDTLKKLKDIYEINSIPVIIVYTQNLSEEKCELMNNFIKENCDFKYDFNPVLAKPEKTRGGVIEPFGIDELKETSIERAKEGVKASFCESFFLQIKKVINNNVNDIETKTKSFLENTLKNKINKMKDVKCNEDICDDLQNILFKLINKIICFDIPKFLSDESENSINQFCQNFINEAFNQFNSIFESSFYNIGNSDNFYYYVNNRKSWNIDDYQVRNVIDDFKNKKKENIRKRVWLDFAKRHIEDISSLCANLLKTKSDEVYKNIMAEEDLKKFIENISQENLDKIKEQLK